RGSRSHERRQTQDIVELSTSAPRPTARSHDAWRRSALGGPQCTAGGIPITCVSFSGRTTLSAFAPSLMPCIPSIAPPVPSLAPPVIRRSLLVGRWPLQN
ncbi:uncharacterized protein SCHCODRAFT_02712752, partial [Schizophyllum commune H4-8]|uniref:uncharacterized protein n=1 Tax=Schizophyllum commune (strain H4-8 / FGSC 9210) TaxID=578458 RepID=UPI00215E4F36